ncbi:endonuclease/exonuclease/phosphatase family protein [Ornithobacterium rhinotracheale]|uniref:endonuclease/exonuclease/phosphatase family protein n=1 Tax=Ornithobacterium rhinotracheale TaxID=28251 RepID=UPI001FF6AF18|nr:endonuclease [Ornithobacterium rhinotracheale]MCK0204910.1 endonuclease [Ornithobacterium rhinotracheale]
MQAFHSIAFYNVENLFDTFDDPKTFDDDFTPEGKKHWTMERYRNKIGKIAKAISEIGKRRIGYPPSIVGLAEVENKTVLRDLLNVSHLKKTPYRYVHFDSLDERGVDVALIYNTEEFLLNHAEPIRPPKFVDKWGRVDYTRDVLYVNGKLHETFMHIFVVHLPSQRYKKINESKRHAIAELIKSRIDYIIENEENPHIVILGDFNTNPDADTLHKFFKATPNYMNQGNLQFFNPMELLMAEKKYTTTHRGDWIFYDQMLFSKAFMNEYDGLNLVDADVFNPYFLQEWKRKYRGIPFRTYVGRKYLGGYSDHFPIYAILKRN